MGIYSLSLHDALPISLTTDGPFAETREQLGGFYLIEAKDLDEALAIAARIPSAKTGTIERSEEHTAELQSRRDLVCRLLLEKRHMDRRGCVSSTPRTR